MADSPLIIKSKEFALQIIKVCNYVKQTKKESVLTNKLSVVEQVWVQTFAKHFMVTVLLTLSQNYKFPLKNVLKVNIGLNS